MSLTPELDDDVLARLAHQDGDGLAGGRDNLVEGRDGLAGGRDNLVEGRDGLAGGRDGLAEGRDGLVEGRDGLAGGRDGLAEGMGGGLLLEVLGGLVPLEGAGLAGDEEEEEEDDDDEAALMLASALKRMDGLIGDYKPPSPDPEPCVITDPIAMEIAAQCDNLRQLVAEYEEKHRHGNESVGPHPRECIPNEHKEPIINWLLGKRSESPQQADQLRRDKEELLKQVVSLQKEVEHSSEDSSKLSSKAGDLHKKVTEKEHAIRTLAEDLRITKATLNSKELELRQLQDQVQTGYRAVIRRSSSPPVTDTRGPLKAHRKRMTVGDRPVPILPERRNSFKKTLVNAFKKKSHTATFAEPETDNTPHPPANHRAANFFVLNSHQLGQWFQSIGLDMYSGIIERSVPSGQRLVEMVEASTNNDLVQIGIVSTMHLKKVKLAVESALLPDPGPLEQLDHNWVAEWLKSLGLPQYQRTFLDGRLDGRMLNVVSLEDLRLLDITTPFHIITLKRAIQALRMCGYDHNYLGHSQKGSQKLLHWTAQDVRDWVCSIELEEYVHALNEMGIHGAVMLLEVEFTSESLSKALGISPSKALIRKHLSRKFMEVIGPVAAQNKVDAMQGKGFQPLDPTDKGSSGGGHRTRSRSTGSRRRRSKTADEDLLCCLNEFPPAEPLRKQTTSPVSSEDPPLSP